MSTLSYGLDITGQVLGYVRVSNTDQDPASQVKAIGEVEEAFTDHVGGGSRETRTDLATMLRHARRGHTMRVALDGPPGPLRGRPGPDRHRADRPKRQVEFVAEHLSFDPEGQHAFAVFRLHLLGSVAQLERSLIRERQREGIALAKQRGVYHGRARCLDEAAVAEERRLAAARAPKAKIARYVGCSRRGDSARPLGDRSNRMN